MSDPYGVHTWTCGECGDTYSASGVVGDSRVARWEREHHDRHYFEKMTPDQRRAHFDHELATLRHLGSRRS